MNETVITGGHLNPKCPPSLPLSHHISRPASGKLKPWLSRCKLPASSSQLALAKLHVGTPAFNIQSRDSPSLSALTPHSPLFSPTQFALQFPRVSRCACRGTNCPSYNVLQVQRSSTSRTHTSHPVTMANGIVRLERFFASRRKPSGSAPATEPSSPVSASEPQFPSPSFIRPTKASRMTARKETYTKNTLQSSSLADVTKALLGSGEAVPQSTQPTKRASKVPTIVRSASFDDSRSDSLFTELLEFPEPPKELPDQLPLLESLDLEDMFDGFASDSSASTSGLASLENMSTPARTSTPLSPGSEAVDIDRLVDSLNKKLPAIPTTQPPSPVLSLHPGPSTDWGLDDPSETNIINTDLLQDIERRLGESMPRAPLRTATSDSTLMRTSERFSLSSVSSSILREPDFDDFMTLSDEDIAETPMPPSPLLTTSEASQPSPPPSPVPSASSSAQPPRPRSLLTLSPPYASKPAAAAAYEAARIAQRYDFDLVYVVNLWPDSTRPRTPKISGDDARSLKAAPYHMTGRLLAAYGLDHVKSPFQISAAVHTKILRAEEWIEYRSQEARSDEFARGYACSFFTGAYSRSNSIDSNLSAASGSTRSRIDRGLVFAAYRKPRADGSMRCSDEQELKAIRGDAEGLVEMLIDIYAKDRLRQAPLFTKKGEAGAIPPQHFQFS